MVRYLNTVHGLEGKKIGSVVTFGGPPLPVFEKEMMETSMNRIVNEKGACIIAHLGLSSGYHELGVMPIFEGISLIRLFKPLSHFIIGSAYAEVLIRRFCDTIESDRVAHITGAGQ